MSDRTPTLFDNVRATDPQSSRDGAMAHEPRRAALRDACLLALVELGRATTDDIRGQVGMQEERGTISSRMSELTRPAYGCLAAQAGKKRNSKGVSVIAFVPTEAGTARAEQVRAWAAREAS